MLDTDSSPGKLENSFHENYCITDNRFFDRLDHVKMTTSHTNTYLGTYLNCVEHAEKKSKQFLVAGTVEIRN